MPLVLFNIINGIITGEINIKKFIIITATTRKKTILNNITITKTRNIIAHIKNRNPEGILNNILIATVII